MSGKTWSIISGIIGGAGFVMGLLSPIVESKAAPYEEEQVYKKFEQRYGLKPIQKKEED